MKFAALFFISPLFLSAAIAQSLQCELMRNEILADHARLTIDKCEIEYGQCIAVGRMPAECIGLRSSCNMGQRDIFGNKQRDIQILNQRLAQYKHLCEK
jgi:hypothetical protein